MKDPRAAITLVVLLALGFLGTGSQWFLLLGGLYLLFWTLKARLPLNAVVRGGRSILWFVAIIVLFNLFSTDGSIIVSLAGLYGTREGLARGISQAVRLAMVLWGSLLLVRTTKPEGFLDAAEWAVRKRSFPPLSVAVLGLLYLPVLVDSARRVREARVARGDVPARGIAGGVWIAAASALPLFAAALRASEHLANAMEARCYEPARRRTPFVILRMRRGELIALIIMGLALAGALTGVL
jgi:energy-coupling factor transport system permease protein